MGKRNAAAMELEQSIEQDLFSAWISGEHREDIALFSAGIFPRPRLFNAIKANKDLNTLIDEGIINYSDAAALLDYTEAFYLTAKKAGLRVCLNVALNQYGHMESAADRLALLDKIEKLRCLVDNKEYIAKEKNFVQIFKDEINFRQTEVPALYGFKDLDEVTGGIHRKQLIVLGARTGQGKSALSLQIADNVQRAGNKVLYIPLEMTTYETFERLLIRHELVTAAETKHGKVPAQKLPGIEKYLQDLEENKRFIVYEGMAELDEIAHKIKIEQPYLVVIDQLTQVTTAEKTKDTRERYMQVTRQLKALALKENVAILLLSQLNRESEKAPRLTAAHLHESDSTGQDADVIIMLTQDENQATPDKLTSVTLTLVKQRQGRNGVTIPLAFYGSKYDFKNSFSDHGPFVNRPVKPL